MDVVQGGISDADNVMSSSMPFWSAVSASSLESSWAQMLKIQAYTLEELREATGDFSSLLGVGSNGQVFAGILDGRPVAVKRLRRDAWDVPAEREVLEHEIKSIAAVNHANIVPLLGFCLEGETPLLVCPQLRSLQENLPFLNWEARYHIAIGVARALAYLHLGAREPMIHCDVKPGNVLYQEGSHDAYLADFGLVYFVRSREELLPDQMINQGNRAAAQEAFVHGSRGYMAPEVKRGEISTEADVYSYGKLLYVLVSGHQDVDSVSRLPPSLVITRRAAAFLGSRSRITAIFSSLFQHRTNLHNMVDRILRPDVLHSSRLFLQASKALDLFALCIAEPPSRRPNMEEVVAALEKAKRCRVPCIIKATVVLGPNIPKILTFPLLLIFCSHIALVSLITIFYTFLLPFQVRQISNWVNVQLPLYMAGHAPSPFPGVDSKSLQLIYLNTLLFLLMPYAFVVLYTTILWVVIFEKLLYKTRKVVRTIR